MGVNCQIRKVYLCAAECEVKKLKDEVLRHLTERAGIPYGVTEIARELNLAPSTVQEQLNRLYKEGEISKTRRGQYVGFKPDGMKRAARGMKSLAELFP